MAAALIVACADLWRAYSAAKEGQYGMMLLYIAAAFAGAGVAVALVVGLMIEHFEDNKLEDWLERCPWGILPKERYPNEQVEQAAFQAALKGS